MTLRATLSIALLATLARPSTWVLALAGFLIRGGIVWFVVPIIVLPTPAVLANVLGPTVIDIVLGGATLGVVAILTVGAVAAVLWFVGGGLLAAATEVELIRIVAAEDELETTIAGSTSRLAIRVLAVRLVALLPMMIAVFAGASRIVAVTYEELTLPSDITTAVAWRVAGAVPETIAAIALTWSLGELVGAVAARRVVLDDGPIVRGLVGALTDLARRPLRMLALGVVPLVALLLVLIPISAAVTVAWSAVRTALDDGSPLSVVLAVGFFVALWAGGLALTGAVCAWRAAVWTVHMVRSRNGTFGASATGRPGDWNHLESSGTL